METQSNHIHISPLLQSLFKASKHLQLQLSPLYTLLYQTDPRPAIQALLTLVPDPSLSSKLSQSLTHLQTLSHKLDKLHTTYTLRSLLLRHVIHHQISQTALAVQSHIQSFSDQKLIDNLLTSLTSGVGGGFAAAAAEFRSRLSSGGFDGDFQELILRRRVFPALELALSGGEAVRDEAAVTILALVEFNRHVFVGLCLMGPTAGVLIRAASLTSIRVLRALVGVIGGPMAEWIGSEREARVGIVEMLWSGDMVKAVAAMDVVLEVAFMGTREVVEAVVVGEGVVERMVELQRRMERGEHGGGAGAAEAVRRSMARGSCVGRLVASVEVGEGMDRRDRREVREQILRLLGECRVSEEEFAAVVADVFW